MTNYIRRVLRGSTMDAVKGSTEQIAKKKRKCWLPAFSSFPKMFSNPSLLGSLKLGIVWYRIIPLKLGIVWYMIIPLKVALQIFGQKFYTNTKKSSLYAQSLLIFIHRTLVVKRHPTTREIRDLLWPRSTPMGNTVCFTWAVCSFIHWKYTGEASNIAFDEDIMKNYYMFVMLWNLSVISHWIFSKCIFHLWRQI